MRKAVCVFFPHDQGIYFCIRIGYRILETNPTMKHLTLILIAFGMLTVPMQAQLDSLNIPADCPCTEEIAPVCVELPDGTVVPLPNACIAECLGCLLYTSPSPRDS